MFLLFLLFAYDALLLYERNGLHFSIQPVQIITEAVFQSVSAVALFLLWNGYRHARGVWAIVCLLSLGTFFYPLPHIRQWIDTKEWLYFLPVLSWSIRSILLGGSAVSFLRRQADRCFYQPALLAQWQKELDEKRLQEQLEDAVDHEIVWEMPKEKKPIVSGPKQLRRAAVVIGIWACGMLLACPFLFQFLRTAFSSMNEAVGYAQRYLMTQTLTSCVIWIIPTFLLFQGKCRAMIVLLPTAVIEGAVWLVTGIDAFALMLHHQVSWWLILTFACLSLFRFLLLGGALYLVLHRSPAKHR